MPMLTISLFCLVPYPNAMLVGNLASQNRAKPPANKTSTLCNRTHSNLSSRSTG
jgi:hypothetical protein